MSAVLDKCPQIAELVYADLICGLYDPEAGREGQMSADQVYRALLIKQMNGYSYKDLAFHLSDSKSYRAFCRFGIGEETPSESTLGRDIKRIGPETLEQINRILTHFAQNEGIEKGRKVRADCAVVQSNIHHPTDSSLLEDCVRVLSRLTSRAREEFGLSTQFVNHHRSARKRALKILNAKNKKKQVAPYKDLLGLTERTMGYAQEAIVALLALAALNVMGAEDALLELRHFVSLTEQVISQTQRRVFDQEMVPAQEKVVSIFEPHTDIIVKDRRETHYGHKIALSGGASGMITDLMVLDGNPADSTLPVTLIERQKEIYGRVPRQAAFDGGFTSRANLIEIKEAGVKDVAFHKKRGLEEEEMTKSHWVYKSLRNFRAGIEGMISYLMRSFGLRRCTWRGLASFKSYAWSSVNALNLLLIARRLLA
jgi:IS5 family transposase